MTVLHLKGRTGGDGTVRLGDVSLGVPNADVDVTFSIKPPVTDDAAWKAQMRRLLDELGEVHLESYPRRPLKDKWSEA